MMTKANTKYKTVKRKANVGERILIKKPTITEGAYSKGSIGTVSYHCPVFDELIYVKGWGQPVLTKEYEVIIEESPSNSERITALESQVAELQAELQAMKKRKKPKHPTPNEQRKAVIERAKAFVTEYSAEIRQHRLLAPRFFINPTKRTVVCLLDRYDLGYIHAKGIAKCAPDDVFNADIGKAIALGRALGLDVSEFENAPKPTEVVVGMRVEAIDYFNRVYTATAYDGIDSRHTVSSLNYSTLHRITDDTDAKY